MSLTDILKNIKIAFLPASLDDYLGKREYVGIGFFPRIGDYLCIWSANQEGNERRSVEIYGEGEIGFNTAFRRGKRVSEKEYAPAAQVVKAKQDAYAEIKRLCGERGKEFNGLYYFSFQDSEMKPVNRELVLWSIGDYWRGGIGRHTSVVVSPDGNGVIYNRASPDAPYAPEEQLRGNYKQMYDTACILLKPEQSDDLSPLGTVRQFYNALQTIGRTILSSGKPEGARASILAVE